MEQQDWKSRLPLLRDQRTGEPVTVPFGEWECQVMIERYHDGGLSLRLVDQEGAHASRKELRHVDLECLFQAQILYTLFEEAAERSELLMLAEEVPPVVFGDVDVGFFGRFQADPVGRSGVLVAVLLDVLSGRAQPVEGDDSVFCVVAEEAVELDMEGLVVQHLSDSVVLSGHVDCS